MDRKENTLAVLPYPFFPSKKVKKKKNVFRGIWLPDADERLSHKRKVDNNGMEEGEAKKKKLKPWMPLLVPICI